MKNQIKQLLLALVLLPALNAQFSTAFAQGTAFTYQGQLQNNGSPASGIYNLTFSLYGTNITGVPIAEPVTNNAVKVTNGLFTVTIDFGTGAFTGETNWLQIGVETNLAATFTPLTPRQQLTPVPYALYAENAGNLLGLVLQQNTDGAPNLIGGSSINFVSGGVVGATIAGGGAVNYYGEAYSNSVTADFGTVGGGAVNIAGNSATVGGGYENTASGESATVGGGDQNIAGSGSATVAGGYENTASGSASFVGGGEFNNSGFIATVGGGYLNIASGTGAFIGGGGYDGTTYSGNNAIGNAAVIGGGLGNTIQTNATDSTIGGGAANSIQNSAYTSIIAGGANNTIQTNATDSTIGGGTVNSIQTNAYQSTIAGGNQNVIQPNAYQSTIGGGNENVIQMGADDSTIGGGFSNKITSGAIFAFIGGGQENTSSGAWATVTGGYLNTASGELAMVGGGYQNIASGTGAFIGGGGYDGTTISGNSAVGNASVIGGGLGNNIASDGNYAVIGGGDDNWIIQANPYGTIAGGLNNTNAGYAAFIGGGRNNSVTSPSYDAVINGGYFNSVSNSADAVIGGGQQNVIQANSQWATIPGGYENVVSGNYGFAAGDNAHATNSGAFVWSDGTGTLTTSTNNNSVTMRASGGYRFFSGTPNTTYAYLAPGSGSWTSMSDRNVKEHFQAVNPLDVLKRVAGLPVSTWNYKTQPAGIRHIGPTAQDFKAAFAVGETDTGISTVDEGGVALAAIQGLNQKLNEKDEEIQTLKQQNDSLAQRLNELEAAVKQLAANK